MVGIFSAVRVVHSQLGPDEDLSGRRGRAGRVCDDHDSRAVAGGTARAIVDDHDSRAMARGTTRTVVDAIRGNRQRGGTAGYDGQESDAHEGDGGSRLGFGTREEEELNGMAVNGLAGQQQRPARPKETRQRTRMPLFVNLCREHLFLDLNCLSRIKFAAHLTSRHP